MTALWKKLALALVATLLALEVGLQALAGLGRLGLFDRGSLEAGSEATILCLGDSHTFGAGVLLEHAYPAQLELALRKRHPQLEISVLNSGVPGVNSAWVANRLEAWIRTVRPVAVIVWVGTNNMWNHLEGEAWDQIEGAAQGDSRMRRLLLRSKLWRLATVLYETSELDFDLEEYMSERGAAYLRWLSRGKERDPAHVEATISFDMERMVTTARSLDTPIVFVTYPQPGRKLPVSPVIEKTARRLDVPVVVTARDLERARGDGYANEQLFVFAAGLHPSPKLYGYVVESLVPIIEAALRERSTAAGEDRRS